MSQETSALLGALKSISWVGSLSLKAFILTEANELWLCMPMQAWNSRTQEVEAGEIRGLRSTWTM